MVPPKTCHEKRKHAIVVHVCRNRWVHSRSEASIGEGCLLRTGGIRHARAHRISVQRSLVKVCARLARRLEAALRSLAAAKSGLPVDPRGIARGVSSEYNRPTVLRLYRRPTTRWLLEIAKPAASGNWSMSAFARMTGSTQTSLHVLCCRSRHGSNAALSGLGEVAASRSSTKRHFDGILIEERTWSLQPAALHAGSRLTTPRAVRRFWQAASDGAVTKDESTGQ